MSSILTHLGELPSFISSGKIKNKNIVLEQNEHWSAEFPVIGTAFPWKNLLLAEVSTTTIASNQNQLPLPIPHHPTDSLKKTSHVVFIFKFAQGLAQFEFKLSLLIKWVNSKPLWQSPCGNTSENKNIAMLTGSGCGSYFIGKDPFEAKLWLGHTILFRSQSLNSVGLTLKVLLPYHSLIPSHDAKI